MECCPLAEPIIDLVQRKVPPAHEISNFSRLFEHLNTKPTAFKKWRDSTFDKLLTLYPRPVDYLGQPVPPQILDDGPFDPAMASEQIHQFLQGLDPATNPFLATAEQMLAAGFTGIPYTYTSNK